ncbi:unnamed protein product [Closterium sp. NIES-54]
MAPLGALAVSLVSPIGCPPKCVGDSVLGTKTPSAPFRVTSSAPVALRPPTRLPLKRHSRPPVTSCSAGGAARGATAEASRSAGSTASSASSAGDTHRSRSDSSNGGGSGSSSSSSVPSPFAFVGLDYYQILGVPVGAPPADIRRAYRALQKKYHPDIAGAQFFSLNDAPFQLSSVYPSPPHPPAATSAAEQETPAQRVARQEADARMNGLGGGFWQKWAHAWGAWGGPGGEAGADAGEGSSQWARANAASSTAGSSEGNSEGSREGGRQAGGGRGEEGGKGGGGGGGKGGGKEGKKGGWFPWHAMLGTAASSEILRQPAGEGVKEELIAFIQQWATLWSFSSELPLPLPVRVDNQSDGTELTLITMRGDLLTSVGSFVITVEPLDADARGETSDGGDSGDVGEEGEWVVVVRRKGAVDNKALPGEGQQVGAERTRRASNSATSSHPSHTQHSPSSPTAHQQRRSLHRALASAILFLSVPSSHVLLPLTTTSAHRGDWHARVSPRAPLVPLPLRVRCPPPPPRAALRRARLSARRPRRAAVGGVALPPRASRERVELLAV